MNLRNTFVLSIGLLAAAPAFAVDFGVMETADVIDTHQFKFIAYPLAVRKAARQEQNFGVDFGLGYGVMRNLDAEVQIATYDDITYFGGDLEYAFLGGLDGGAVDMSIGGGAHLAQSDFGDPWGLDATYIASYTLPGTKVRLNGAVDVAREHATGHYAASMAVDQDYWTAYATPGVQYRWSRDMDVIGEVGVGLTGESNDYAAVGLSYYFR